MFSWYQFTELFLLILFSQERHKALEEMGISVQSSGIAVEKSKFYLVNLNADPSMNELLVYYLQVTLQIPWLGLLYFVRQVMSPFSRALYLL